MSRETWCDNCRKLIEELANVRREAVFAINKAQTERSEQIYDEGELSGYSRGVADTEVQRESDAEARLAKAQALLEEYSCWDMIGSDGFHADPDSCYECEQDREPSELCWVGKMKVALVGQPPKGDSCTKGEVKE